MAKNSKYNDLPRWVKKAYGRFERKLGNGVINVEKTFVGRTFLYHVKFETLGQHHYSQKWTIEKRYKGRNELIFLILALTAMVLFALLAIFNIERYYTGIFALVILGWLCFKL